MYCNVLIDTFFVISQKYLATGYNMNARVVICQADKQKELEVVGTTCWSANPSGTYLNKITLLRGDDDDVALSLLNTIIFRAVWRMM